MSRFDKADADLGRWRNLRDRLLAAERTVPLETQSVVRAIDSAFKSEVQEQRLRQAVNAQTLNESEVAHVPQQETLTGRHLWDFDWWLTEATLRSLHAGIDAVAQLLNIAFRLQQNPDDPGLPMNVYQALKLRDDLDSVRTAVENLWGSPECRNLGAFVNHVKHAGFPQRQGLDMGGTFARSTTVEVFTYNSTDFGPWSPDDVNGIIDGFRSHVLAVLAATCEAPTAAG